MEETKEEIFGYQKAFLMSRKKNLMSNPCRMISVVSYLICQTFGCTCTRWRGIEGYLTVLELELAEYMDKKSGQLVVPTNAAERENAYTLTPCATCLHPFSAHIPQEKWQRNPKLMDYTLRVILDCKFIRSQTENVEDLGHGFFKSLSKALHNVVKRSVYFTIQHWTAMEPYTGISFFTPEATLQDSVAAFTFLKTRGPMTQTMKDLAYQLGVQLIMYINQTIYETPSERRVTTGLVDPLYVLNYRRWYLYCHLPQICLSLHHYNCAYAMGPSFFCQTYPVILDRVRKDTADGANDNGQLLKFLTEFQASLSGDEPGVRMGFIFTSSYAGRQEIKQIQWLLKDSQPRIGDTFVDWDDQ